jgi:hypothetical protein
LFRYEFDQNRSPDDHCVSRLDQPIIIDSKAHNGPGSLGNGQKRSTFAFFRDEKLGKEAEAERQKAYLAWKAVYDKCGEEGKLYEQIKKARASLSSIRGE